MELFLFCVLFVALLIALLQDLTRREIDNWLTYALFVFGVVFFVYRAFFFSDVRFFLGGVIVSFAGFLMMFLLYYGRVFAGGDAKLLFAMSPFFASIFVLEGVVSFLLFVFLMFLCGGVYGLFYSSVLYLLNFKKVNKNLYGHLLEVKFYWFLFSAFLLALLSFFLDFVLSRLFFVFSFLLAVFPFLISFARSVEEVVMIREVRGSHLREGDLLVDDVKVNKKKIKASFEGLSRDEVDLLRKKKKVKIKEGIPFAPAFFMALIVYYLYSDSLHNLFFFF